MKPAEATAWLLLGGGSLALASLMIRSPGAPTAPPPPPPLQRHPSADELEQTRSLRAQLRDDLAQARARQGQPLTIDQLEAPLADGLPALAHGLPDSPLRPGIAVVEARCPPTPAAEDRADWLYCEATGELEAVGFPSPADPDPTR